ncbi:MAG: hypothetical protein WCP38_04620, partial [Chloroflexota bacterium]
MRRTFGNDARLFRFGSPRIAAMAPGRPPPDVCINSPRLRESFTASPMLSAPAATAAAYCPA